MGIAEVDRRARSAICLEINVPARKSLIECISCV